MRQIVYNSVKCLECEEVLVSHHVHEYVTCSCPNQTMCDGGNNYERYGGVDLDKIKLLHVYANDDFEEVRRYAFRGSRGKDGKQPLTWIAICDMDDDYLQAVLDYGGAGWHIEIIKKEIEYRKFKTHQKENIIDLMNMDSYSEQNVPKSGTNCEDELKNCACYGSNAMHECNCK